MTSFLTMRRLLLGSAVALSLSAPLAAQVPQQLHYTVPVIGRVDGYYTELFVATATAAQGTMNMAYHYQLGSTGALGTATASVTIPGRWQILITDLIASYFGIYENSMGRLELELPPTMMASARIRFWDQDSSVTLESAGSPAFMTSGFWLDQPGAVRDFYSGTNLILTETGSGWADVNVQLIDASGNVLGERLYGLGPNEIRLIVDVFGESGVGLPAGDYHDVTIRVSPWGPGRVVATRMWVDNLYRDFDLSVFGSENRGQPPTGVIGF